MRTLSLTLRAAQQSSSRVPYVEVIARNRIFGVSRLKWERVYADETGVNCHAAAFAGDGSLIRVRISLADDDLILYYQRIINPDKDTDFSLWNSMGQSQCQSVAVAAGTDEVIIVWVNLNRELKCMTSQDGGTSWSSSILLDYIPAAPNYALASVYKPDGTLAIFVNSNDTLFVKKRINGSWQDKIAWDKTTGELSSVSAIYDGDWLLMLSGNDCDENAKIWSLLYGDGNAVPAGEWSELKEFSSAVAGSDCTFGGVFLDKPDVYRVFFVEKLGGINPTNCVHSSYAVPGSAFAENLWREPSPFEYAGVVGLALVHHGGTAWLSSPDGVWLAVFTEQTMDLTSDITGLICENKAQSGNMTIELDNSSGKYKTPGVGDLSVLDSGCELALGIGYQTSIGLETSSGLTFQVEAYEQSNERGKASLVLYTTDGWQLLTDWCAHYSFRWNANGEEVPVKYLLEFVLARAGLRLEVISESGFVTGFAPDFTIHRGDIGLSILNRLLSFVPDMIFIEGNTAYLLNPQTTDMPEYSYGQDHIILRGNYQTRSWEVNRVQITGYDPATGGNIIEDIIRWEQIIKLYERQYQVSDRNLGTLAQANARGFAILRKTEIATVRGEIVVPVNCGQRLYDIIGINEASAGLSAAKRRILGISLNYRPRNAEFTQRLELGAV